MTPNLSGFFDLFGHLWLAGDGSPRWTTQL